jgi:hypothetical protein
MQGQTDFNIITSQTILKTHNPVYDNSLSVLDFKWVSDTDNNTFQAGVESFNIDYNINALTT